MYKRQEQRELETLDVRLTYYQIDTDEIIRYTRHFSAAELDAFLNDLLRQYLPWARRQLDLSLIHICRFSLHSRYSFRHSHFYTLHSRLRYCFSAYTTLPYPIHCCIA